MTGPLLSVALRSKEQGDAASVDYRPNELELDCELHRSDGRGPPIATFISCVARFAA